MIVSYCFASPQGDVAIDSETLKRPFMAEPLQYHPFMCLGDFFDAIRDVLLGNGGQGLTTMLSRIRKKESLPGDVKAITIRYEKYGTLYQVASVDIVSHQDTLRLAVNAALTPHAREHIVTESNLISSLTKKAGLPYLPHVYSVNPWRIEKDGRVEHMAVAVMEWFDSFHEWHFSGDPHGTERIVIWDMERGNRFASHDEAHSIIREASKILTLYYDIDTGKRINPWHHGAGDFIVKTDSAHVELRLVTARGYEAFTQATHPIADPFSNLLHFLVELTMQMRLDKVEGVGQSSWAHHSFVVPSVQGFLEGMKTKFARGESGVIDVDRFTDWIKSLSEGTIKETIAFRLAEFRARDSSDFQVISSHGNKHAKELVRALRHASAPTRP